MNLEPLKCPKCQLVMREREQGNVIVDICPQCRGVWLDAGELEKLSVRESRYYDDDDDDDDRGAGILGRRDDDDRRGRDDRSYDNRSTDAYGRPRKKKGFLANMMENFGGEGGDD